MSKRPIIIDVDPGNDDAQAIMLLSGSGLFDIRGICAVHGNVGLQHTAPNALYLAGLTGVDCPVCIGAENAILARKTRAEYAHGGNGLGGLEYTVDESKFSAIRPWDLMWQEAIACEGELEIFAVGPLTNVALAVLKYPELPKHVKRLIIMGGAATCGNMSAYGEFNIWQDPHALQ
ncbi:MAG: nucleoside hydrolase, partial [Oscillospiraceae bacterium]|nr:nucleoside hydrolase [Oscillospiraceae bacterium]